MGIAAFAACRVSLTPRHHRAASVPVHARVGRLLFFRLRTWETRWGGSPRGAPPLEGDGDCEGNAPAQPAPDPRTTKPRDARQPLKQAACLLGGLGGRPLGLRKQLRKSLPETGTPMRVSFFFARGRRFDP